MSEEEDIRVDDPEEQHRLIRTLIIKLILAAAAFSIGLGLIAMLVIAAIIGVH